MGPTLIKKVNQFVSFKNGGVKLLESMKFLGEQKDMTRFLKLIKHQKLKVSFPMNGSTVHRR